MFAFLFLFFAAYQSEGRVTFLKDPPRELEEKYSETVLLFYQKKYSQALILAAEILEKAENQKTLELKGLLLKSSGNFAEAKKTYRYIIDRVNEAGLVATEASGAYFDLGTIEFQFKNYDQSQENFSFCITNNFNQGASYFFRGLTNYEKNQYDLAMQDLNAALASNALSIKALAALYLSEIHSKQQSFDEAIFYLGEARRYSDEQKASGLIDVTAELKDNQKSVASKIKQNIRALNSEQDFRNAALILTSDSNVLSVPGSGTVADIFSGKSSTKLTLKGLLGHADGYFEDMQEVWSYQFSGNLNENRQTETGQFLTNDFIYIWNHQAWSEHFESFRLGLNSNFQYQVNPDSKQGAFGPYSLSISGGYSKKDRINENSSLTSDYFIKYENFLQDPVFSSFMKKTGFEAGLSYFKNWDSKKQILNPALGITLRGRLADGSEFRNLGFQLTALNEFYFSQKNLAGLTLSYAYVDYNERPGEKRIDSIYTVEWNQSYKYSEATTALFSYSYTLNNSTITEVYKYDRTLLSAGLSYSF